MGASSLCRRMFPGKCVVACHCGGTGDRGLFAPQSSCPGSSWRQGSAAAKASFRDAATSLCDGAAATAGGGGRNASGRANRSPRTSPRKGTHQDAQNLPPRTPSTIHQDVRDLSVGLETMVGGGGRWSRPPSIVASGDRRPPTI